MGTKRIEWIDIAKGIGIILVIMGHTFQLGVVTPLYAFHMPLFFFLSGLLITPEKVGHFVDFVKHKFKGIIYPWVGYLLVSFCVCLIIPDWRNNLTESNVVDDLYSANTNCFQNSSLWYLPSFFFALIFYYWMNKRFKGSRMQLILFVGYALLLLKMKDLLALTELPQDRLPLKMDTALLATVFIAVASWSRQLLFGLITRLSKIVYVALLAIATAGMSYGNGWANMNSLDFGRVPFLYYFIAFCGILFVCVLSSYLCSLPLTRVKELFAFYGKNSLIIFALQSLYIRLYLYVNNSIFDLNMVLYGKNPVLHQIGSFVMVAFIASPLTVLLLQWGRHHLPIVMAAYRDKK